MTNETRSDDGGYEPRFVVERADGQPISPDRRYMVLSFDGSDPEAVAALQMYATFKENKNPKLAAELRAHLASPESAPKQHRY